MYALSRAGGVPARVSFNACFGAFFIAHDGQHTSPGCWLLVFEEINVTRARAKGIEKGLLVVRQGENSKGYLRL